MKEIYYWIIFIVIIIAGALAFKYYYRPAIDIGLSFSSAQQGSAYSYQQISLPLVVVNNGSAVKDFDVGIVLNGNLTGVYNVTLSSGKETIIDLTHTFTSPGVYNFTAVGDPGKLYNLADRSRATTSVVVNVLPPVAPDPASLLPDNATFVYASNMTSLGYVVASYLERNYSIGQFNLSDMASVNSYFNPILELTSSYIANLSYAGASYANGNAFSLWFSGYVNPVIIGDGAQSMNLSYSNQISESRNVTVITLNNDTTLCGWYQGGWVRTLAYQGSISCLSVLQESNSGVHLNASLRDKIPSVDNNNTVEIGNISAYNSRWQRYGKIEVSSSDSFLYPVLWKNFTQNILCYGIVNYVNGTSYCSTYYIPTAGALGNTSLIRTTAYVGEYNESVFSLVNSSRIFTQVDNNIAILRAFNVTGTSLNFTNELANQCSFTSAFSCSNVTYGNSTVSFKLTNILNTTATVNVLGCFWNGIGPGKTINETLVPQEAANITTVCYNNGETITGVPLNLDLHLLMNYSTSGGTYDIEGNAFII